MKGGKKSMKWIKVAIGALIAIISIGIIATGVYKMTQEKVRVEVVTFEVVNDDPPTFSNGIYQSLLDLSELDDDGFVTNITSMKINGLLFTKPIVFVSDIATYNIMPDSTGYYDIDAIDIDDTFRSAGYDVVIGDTFEITFEVTQPPHLTGISATLILLTPIIFTGGILIYLLKKQNY
jgi:hypothetical protein